MVAALVVAVLVFMPVARAETTVLALGDSLIAGYGLPQAEGFVPQLEAALRAEGQDVRVINAGVSGDTAAGGLARVDWLLQPKPDVALVSLGANDGLRGLDPAATRESLDDLLSRLAQAGVPTLLAGMLAPPNMGPDYARKFNPLFPEVAQANGASFYPFFLDGVAAEPALNQPDGIHPNADGVAVMVARILPHMRRLLDRAGR